MLARAAGSRVRGSEEFGAPSGGARGAGPTRIHGRPASDPAERRPRAAATLEAAAAFRRRLRQPLPDLGPLLLRQHRRDLLLHCNLVSQALALRLDELLLQRRDLLGVGRLGEHLGFELAPELHVCRRPGPGLAFGLVNRLARGLSPVRQVDTAEHGDASPPEPTRPARSARPTPARAFTALLGIR